MATSKVSPDSDSVVVEIESSAPPERVFEALTDLKQIAQWWRDEAVTLEDIELELRIGGRWGYQTNKPVDGVNKFRVHGEVLEYDPPRLLAYTWLANLHNDPGLRTVVRWELTRIPRGTRVKLTHSGLSRELKARNGYSSGWVGIIDRLKKFVER